MCYFNLFVVEARPCLYTKYPTAVLCGGVDGMAVLPSPLPPSLICRNPAPIFNSYAPDGDRTVTHPPVLQASRTVAGA